MPRKTDTACAAETLTALLAQHEDWKHLGCKTKGRKLLVVVKEHGEENEVAKLEYVGDGQYALYILWHNGKWQRVPVVGGLAEVVKALREGFGPLLCAW
jgi:hypothetical protein